MCRPVNNESLDQQPRRTRAQRLLIIGAVSGLLLAASGLLENKPDIDAFVVATVNEQFVSKEDYLNYLSMLAKNKRNPLTDSDRRRVLNRMIEEKLIIERGIDIGLADTDPNVRKVISDAMTQIIITDVSSIEPSESELEDFYNKNKNYFAKPARIQVQRIIFRGQDKLRLHQRAEKARLLLQNGNNFNAVKTDFGSPEILTIPNSLLPPNKLRQYIGPQLTTAALRMQPGDISKVIDDGAGFTLLYLIAFDQAEPQALADIRQQVANEYRRRAGDEALQEYLQQLRQQADIAIDEVFLESLENNNSVSLTIKPGQQ